MVDTCGYVDDSRMVERYHTAPVTQPCSMISTFLIEMRTGMYCDIDIDTCLSSHTVHVHSYLYVNVCACLRPGIARVRNMMVVNHEK